MGNLIVEAIELLHGDGFGVDDEELGLVLTHLSAFLEEGECSSEDLDATSLSGEGQADNHKTMSHKDHLIELDYLGHEVIGLLQVHLL